MISVVSQDFKVREESFGQTLSDLHRKWQEVRRPFETSWRVNVLFSRGEQSIMRDGHGNFIRIPVNPDSTIPHITDPKIPTAMDGTSYC